MKICPNCKAEVQDDALFCPGCGTSFVANGTPNNQQSAPPPPPPPYINMTDHTAEFAPQDIHENKIMAMLPYILGPFGIIIALLASRDSKYTMFHVKQGIKLLIVSVLIGIISGVLAITIIVPLAGLICEIIILVLEIIAFFQVCAGKAKEPAIISSLNFLK